MMWDLPKEIYGIAKDKNNDDVPLRIRNECDYRVVLDVIGALNDEELEKEERLKCALFIFYENIEECIDYETASKEMLIIVNNGNEDTEEEQQNDKPPIMDWHHDFNKIAPPITRVLGYSVRDSKNYTHWYDFVGAYMEIGECSFSNIVSIRSKKQKGKKLDKWEEEFYREHKKEIDLPRKLTKEEMEWLDSDW